MLLTSPRLELGTYETKPNLKILSGYSILDVVISASMYFTLSEIDWLPEIFRDYYITNPKYFEYVNVKTHFRYLAQSEKNIFLQKYILY